MATLDPHAVLGHRGPAPLRALTLDAMATQGRARRLDNVRRAGASLAGPWLAFARRNRVGPLVAHALLDAFGDDHPDAPTWRAEHDASAQRMGHLMAALDEVAQALDSHDIPVVALKNAGIARGIFPCAACVPMGDLDLLVAKRDYLRGHDVLLSLGFELATRSAVEPADVQHGLVGGGTEYRRPLPAAPGEEAQDLWVELQWRPVAGRWIRRDQEPDGAALMARSVAIPDTNPLQHPTKVRLLAPDDNLLQVALHTAKHSYCRAPGLRLHTDVDRLTAYQPPDWDHVARMATDLHIRTAVYFSLALARALLDTPVPDAPLAALSPPAPQRAAITRMLRRADIFEPDQRKFSRPAMMAFASLLYDDPAELLASALDTERGGLVAALRPSRLPSLARRAARRLTDVATRYDR